MSGATYLRHGHSRFGQRSPTYESWAAMIQRCTSPNYKFYARYGGRGIKVCERWRDFRNFLADMGERPHGLTLDRINNGGNYEPGNVRWATRRQQVWNSTKPRLFCVGGEILPLSSWARRLGTRPSALLHRINRGWPITKALTQPMRVR